ncbi:uncharacterized protein LOC129582423 [Paramacrobiotus metropolitanus]|uniref:uncharacterized protein LOC129582423 n=1 Tax=Paramacrobiotus metropolitanus TaxID=2943436 RepID=UPI002446255D|nr:uncharacterized protein LOC129582423 [Paramacrobiotus metropolitanus]
MARAEPDLDDILEELDAPPRSAVKGIIQSINNHRTVQQCLDLWLRFLLHNPLIGSLAQPVVGQRRLDLLRLFLVTFLSACLIFGIQSLIQEPLAHQQVASAQIPAIILFVANLPFIFYCVRGLTDVVLFALQGPSMSALVRSLRDGHQCRPPAFLVMLSFVVMGMMVSITAYKAYASLLLANNLPDDGDTSRFLVWNVSEKMVAYASIVLIGLVDFMSTITAGFFAGVILLYITSAVTPLLQDLGQLKATIATTDTTQLRALHDEILRCHEQEKALPVLFRRIMQMFSPALSAWLLMDILIVIVYMARSFAVVFKDTAAEVEFWMAPMPHIIHAFFVVFMAEQPKKMGRKISGLWKKLQEDVFTAFYTPTI